MSAKRRKNAGATRESASAKQRLNEFIATYDPAIAGLARAVLEKMRKRLPAAVQLVYDNYNALAIGFGPTERASQAIFSIAVWPRWVSLFFLQGAKLRDPQKLLKGSGNRVRHIVLASAADLDKPGVRALMVQAVEGAEPPFDEKSRGRIIIKSVSAKQRARRHAGGKR